MEKCKARLSAEFTKARIKAEYPTLEAWRVVVGKKEVDSAESAPQSRHPRWVRINTLAELDPMATAFAEYKKVSLKEVCLASSDDKVLAVDEHVPNLIALPSGTDVTKTSAYRDGSIILQDKASCFSAYLLHPSAGDGDIIDACAAPGNKTTHTAALLAEARKTSGVDSDVPQTVYACERDKGRAQILAKMTKIANPRDTAHIECLLGQDFLRLSPRDKRFKHVGALLLDPSCSGSGIVKRGGGATAESLQVTLPGVTPQEDTTKRPTAKSSKKRKRKAESLPPVANLPSTADTEEQEELISEENEETPDSEEALRTRLTNLSAFQLKIVQHAFAFPAAKRVVYSTCSIHAEENENVVVKALRSPIARERGWRVLRREEQVDGMKRWHVRGDLGATKSVLDDGEDEGGVEDAETIADACIRCEKGTADGTMGFFVVGFVREQGQGNAVGSARRQEHEAAEAEEEDDWSGFDSD